MSRLQVLELPAQVLGDAVHTPFVLVIDEADEKSQFRHITGAAEEAMKEELGARGIIITADTVEIPANWSPPVEVENLDDINAALQK